VVATTNYSTGALATVDLGSGCVQDRHSSRLGGDPLLVSVGDQLAVVLRGDGDVIRLYEPGSWRSPTREIAVPVGSNIHDVFVRDDRLFATAYDGAELLVYDLASEHWLTGVDLSPYADEDGLPEADRVHGTEAGLMVALQRLNRDDGWSSGEGRILTVDTERLEVVAEQATGPSPKLFEDRVLSGVYGSLDGALETLEGEVLLTELDEGFDFAVYGARDGLSLLAGSTLEGRTRLLCHDGDGWQQGPLLDAWVSDLVPIGDGGAVLATRTGWNPDATSGLVTLDMATCEVEGDPIHLSLEPYSLEIVELDE